MLRQLILTLLITVMFSSCNWVDSTGAQSGSDAPILLTEGQVVELVEQNESAIDPRAAFPESELPQNLVWQPEPLQQGNLPACASLPSFEEEDAVDSLEEACFESSECEIYFEPASVSDLEGERSIFNITPPVIKAPVGITFQLVANEAGGIKSQANFTFCLIPENQPPTATDDIYPVVEGQILSVTAGASGLLANDIDDTESDVRNLPLSVITPASRLPTLAESFELFPDGSFTYIPSKSIDLATGGAQTDEFEYQITDGTFIDTGRVLINIVPEDDPPVLLQPLPDVNASVGIESTVTLSEYFSDPEGGELSFVIQPNGLPPSGNFTLEAGGVLVGTATVQDVGIWQVSVSATDLNLQQVTSSFTLRIVANSAPTSTPIPVQSIDIKELFSLDASQFFTDPEGDALKYTLTSAQALGIQIDPVSGIISGFFSADGTFRLTVSASDGVNQPVSRVVSVVVTQQVNRAPVQSGLIANQSVKAGQVMKPMQGNFSDPDGDPLVYSIIGSLPSGVALSPTTGIIQGRPKTAGVYANRRIVATDPGGLKAESDPFTLTVVATVVNRAPVYSGTIANQVITLGDSIAPIQGQFSDPDGDVLSYSIDGTRPLGLVLLGNGTLTGTPVNVGLSPNLRIVATDPAGLTAQSDIFRIRVLARTPNVSPVYTGAIANQVLRVGVLMQPISGSFSDADDDVLVYSMRGVLPTGVQLSSSTGIISGTPTEAGVFRNLAIVASDPDKLQVASDVFTLRVRR